MAFAEIEIQDLTFTEKQFGLGVTVTYRHGGTAGSEVVTVSNDRAITVVIEPGVSTATQIKTKVDAHPRASELVTVTVSGTGSTAQQTCVLAALAGGAAAVAASKQFNGLYVEALTAGTAGNSIRLVFEDDDEDVTVSTNDITVKFPNGTTAARVAALINADVEANLLVKASGSSADTLRDDMAIALTALAGGAAVVAPSVIVQDLTFSSDTTGTSLNGRKMSYSTGATAGSEVVTVDGSGNVNVQIENGVSTATQIAAALNASADFTGVKASGTVTVADYTKASAVAASGTVTVADYTKASAVAASGLVTVVDYAALHGQAASLVVQDLTYTAVDEGPGGNAITVEYVDGGAIGDNAIVECDGNAIVVHIDDTAVTGTSANTVKAAVNADPEASLLVLVTGAAATVQALEAEANLEDGQDPAVLTVNGTALTEGVDWDAATDNDTTAADLETAIEAVANISSSAAANAITVAAAATGTAGNAYTLATSDAVNLTISGALLTGGRAATIVTVNGTPLTANVDWTAETDNDTTAANLEVAIEAVTDISSSATNAVITVSAAATGTAGNAYTLATSNIEAVTVSGALLTGGRAATTVTVAGTALVANVNWTAETSNNVTADNLSAAIDAISEVTAANPAAAVITVIAAAPGTAGNAYGLVTSNTEAVTVGAATLASGTDLYAVTVSGTGSDAQVTVNAEPTAGATSAAQNAFYEDQASTALTSAFVAFDWGFSAGYVRLVNDETSGTDTIVFSYDGVNTHGTLTFGEELVLGSESGRHGIFLKYANAAPNYRLTALV